jgi:hypothetical protein
MRSNTTWRNVTAEIERTNLNPSHPMNKKAFVILALILFGAVQVQAQLSAYLPEQGQFIITSSSQYQRYGDFWLGGTRIELEVATGFDEQRQFSTYLTFEYGILPDLAIDATLGYTWAEFTRGPSDVDDLTDDGMTDTAIGLRYRILDEHRFSWAPTVTVRVGGILPGTYDDAFPFSAGDGAGGFETSLLVAREICPHFGVYGEFGYRWRDHDVPEELFGTAGFWATCHGFTLSAGYRQTESTHGPDIGDPGFGVDFGFPQTREIDKRLEASVGYTDDAGRNYSVYYAHTIDGRNTGDKSIYGLAISIPFGGERRAPEGYTKGYGKQ